MNAKSLRKIAFVTEEFSARSPAQQLLDRFLIGYPHDGEFQRMAGCQFFLTTPNAESAEVKSRVNDFGLQIAVRPVDAVGEADAVVVVWRGSGAVANPELLKATIDGMRAGARCFVYGSLANVSDVATNLISFAKSKGAILCSGASVGVTYRLPDIEIPMAAHVRDGLIVVQGPFPDAEFEALDGLLPIMARRRSGESGARQVRFLSGHAVWEAGGAGEWAWPLLAAAISRSNTVQGDPLKDGRTQDVAGLGLVPALAKDPRCWLIEHRDGVRSTILVLDGVVADYNFAVRLADGDIISAQLYRPPPPMRDEFSRLARAIGQFFQSGVAPWPVERSVLTAGLLEAFAKGEARNGAKVEISGQEFKL